MTPETELAQLSTSETLAEAIAPHWLDEVRTVALFVPVAIAFLLVSTAALAFALVAGAMLSPAIVVFGAWWMARHDRALTRERVAAPAH